MVATILFWFGGMRVLDRPVLRLSNGKDAAPNLRRNNRRQFMKNNDWFRNRAKELYCEEGQIEVDSNARVSIGDDDGAYVEAWVWVSLKEEQSSS
jgi:hypothetical protein